MAILVIVLIIVWGLSGITGAASTAQCRKEGRQFYSKVKKNSGEYQRRKAAASNCYFDPKGGAGNGFACVMKNPNGSPKSEKELNRDYGTWAMYREQQNSK